jgi:hypothetical protein
MTAIGFGFQPLQDAVLPYIMPAGKPHWVLRIACVRIFIEVLDAAYRANPFLVFVNLVRWNAR